MYILLDMIYAKCTNSFAVARFIIGINTFFYNVSCIKYIHQFEIKNFVKAMVNQKAKANTILLN